MFVLKTNVVTYALFQTQIWTLWYQFKMKIWYLLLFIVYNVTCSLSWRVLIYRWAISGPSWPTCFLFVFCLFFFVVVLFIEVQFWLDTLYLHVLNCFQLFKLINCCLSLRLQCKSIWWAFSLWKRRQNHTRFDDLYLCPRCQRLPDWM
jgi:hypothetical protein